MDLYNFNIHRFNRVLFFYQPDSPAALLGRRHNWDFDYFVVVAISFSHGMGPYGAVYLRCRDKLLALGLENTAFISLEVED